MTALSSIEFEEVVLCHFPISKSVDVHFLRFVPKLFNALRFWKVLGTEHHGHLYMS